MTTAYEHPLTLTSEDGESIWIRHDAAGDEVAALRVYAEEFGLSDEDVECYEPAGGVLMRHEPRDDDPDWHATALEDDDDTCSYWRFNA